MAASQKVALGGVADTPTMQQKLWVKPRKQSYSKPQKVALFHVLASCFCLIRVCKKSPVHGPFWHPMFLVQKRLNDAMDNGICALWLVRGIALPAKTRRRKKQNIQPPFVDRLPNKNNCIKVFSTLPPGDLSLVTLVTGHRSFLAMSHVRSNPPSPSALPLWKDHQWQGGDAAGLAGQHLQQSHQNSTRVTESWAV